MTFPAASPAGAPLPRMVRLRQRFPQPPPVDLTSAVERGLRPLAAGLRPGARVAVAVGSRGITGLTELVRATVRTLQAAGAAPFILPAMGSHGGATAEGQAALLAGYGITETALGVPLRAELEVIEVGTTAAGRPVVCSREAVRADAVVLINRIKPHTDFSGRLGSGLLKMLVVGLGQPAGAAAFHRAAAVHGYESALRAAAAVLLGRVPLLAGVAVVEDPRHRPARVEVVAPADFAARDEALCAAARAWMPRLPVEVVDLLVVDCLGKNISGTGMDPAVIGRMIHGYSLAADAPPPRPQVRRLFVRELTPESHGNAIGIGLADFTTTRLVRAMDRRATATNALTALSLQGAKVPIYFDTDREALAAALASLPDTPPSRARVVRIRDTLSLEWLEVSESLAAGLAGRADLEIHRPPAPWTFDAAGNLPPLAFPESDAPATRRPLAP